MSDSENMLGIVIGAIAIVAIGAFAVKQLVNVQPQQARKGTTFTTKEQKRQSYEQIITEAIRDKDKATLNDLLDSGCVDFPDLIAKIKEELRKMG